MEIEKNIENNQLKQNQLPKSRKGLWIWILVVCLIIVGGYFYFTKTNKSSQNASPATKGGARTASGFPVVTAKAKQEDVNVYLIGLGSVIPLNTVTVKSLVDGQLMKVAFKEGQIVNSGDLLAQIDPRTFQAQLTQTEGQLSKDQALLNNAKLDLDRDQTLAKQDLIGKQELDTQNSLVRQYEGQVQMDQGLVDNAKLQVERAKITSPISGRIGLRLVDEGNIVRATDASGLAVITQLQPITVVFSIPEDNLPQLLAKIKEGKHLTIEAYNREENKKIATGEFLAVDSQIDSTTGTIKIKGIFPNANNELFPNQFVNAHLLIDVKQGAVVIPTAAIQQGPQGAFVYIVKDDRTVTVRPITTGPSQGDDTSIDKGISLDEEVVVEGTDKLNEGSKVQ